MKPQMLVLGMILAAICGYFIVVPIYEILSGAVNLTPITMLGIGIIMAVVLVKVFARIGSFVTLGMLLLLGVLLIIVGIALSSSGEVEIFDTIAVVCILVGGVTPPRASVTSFVRPSR